MPLQRSSHMKMEMIVSYPNIGQVFSSTVLQVNTFLLLSLSPFVTMILQVSAAYIAKSVYARLSFLVPTFSYILHLTHHSSFTQQSTHEHISCPLNQYLAVSLSIIFIFMTPLYQFELDCEGIAVQ